MIRSMGGRCWRRVIATFCLAPLLAVAGPTNSWRIFRSLSSGAALGTNTVLNPGMEIVGSSPPLANWILFGSGYTASTTTAHGGTYSLQCAAATATEVHGGYQTIVLNQTTPKALKLSGWSKAQGVTGSSDSDYSVYLDIIYTNGTPLWGQTIPFSVGTHDWEYKETFIVPALPIKQLNCYVLFRNSHTGTVWFDDISVAEVQDPVVQFDGSAVLASPPIPLPFDPVNPLHPAERGRLAAPSGAGRGRDRSGGRRHQQFGGGGNGLCLRLVCVRPGREFRLVERGRVGHRHQ